MHKKKQLLYIKSLYKTIIYCLNACYISSVLNIQFAKVPSFCFENAIKYNCQIFLFLSDFSLNLPIFLFSVDMYSCLLTPLYPIQLKGYCMQSAWIWSTLSTFHILLRLHHLVYLWSCWFVNAILRTF